MRRNLKTLSLLLGTALFATVVYGQADRFAYAITDVQQEGSNWTYLRKFDFKTGEYSQVLLNGNDMNQVAYDATSKKQIQTFSTVARYGFSTQPAFSSGVAAIALDKRNNRLYYTPMFIDELRYLDLRTMKVYYVSDQAFTGTAEKASTQSNIITRMVIAADGNGYAMSNDGTFLMRFSTGKKSNIVNLGALVDAPENNTVSFHNSCSSYGGDMVADNDGNLYIFTARNTVFKVNIETKVATYLGPVSGLPANYTINGVAVDDNNKILVSSAVNSTACFTVDPATLAATLYATHGDLWRTSDLANSNILQTKKTNTPTDIVSRVVPTSPASNNIRIFPNPVVNNQFTVQFSQLETGSYTLQVTDIMGREVVSRNVVIASGEQTENIKLEAASAKGIYLIKVTDKSNTAVFTSKVVVQ